MDERFNQEQEHELELREELSEDEALYQDKKSGKGKIIVFVILALILGFVVFRVVSERMVPYEETEKALTNVSVESVQLSDIQITTPLSGRIEPNEEVLVSPAAQGKIVGVYVSQGDYVSKGKTLFKIDATQAQLSYDQAKANYQMAVDGVEIAKTNYERMKLLYDEGAISLVEMESTQNQYNNAQQSLAQVQAVLTSAAEAISLTSMDAPISGYVTSVGMVEGAFGGTGITISDTTKLKLNTTLSEYLINSVKEGDTVEVYIKSLSSEPFSGKITNIIPTPAQGTLTYPVTITLENNSKIKSGMFAEVYIVSDQKSNVIVVPSDAVMIKNSRSLVVVMEEGLPVYREVTVGLDNGNQAEIISGLEVGEQIVVKGQIYITEGEKVNIVSQGEETDAI